MSNRGVGITVFGDDDSSHRLVRESEGLPVENALGSNLSMSLGDTPALCSVQWGERY